MVCCNGAVAALREQTVEIALGPKGAFENGNIGTLTRRVSANQVMSAILPPRGKPLSTPSTRQVDRPPRVQRIPRAVEFLCKALEWQALLASGQAKNQADIARPEGISRGRVTQGMWVLRLAPEIQERILAMPKMNRRPVVSERVLRPIAHLEDVMDQKTRFQELIGEVR